MTQDINNELPKRLKTHETTLSSSDIHEVAGSSKSFEIVYIDTSTTSDNNNDNDVQGGRIQDCGIQNSGIHDSAILESGVKDSLSYEKECVEKQNSVLSLLRKTSTGRFILKEYAIHGRLSDASSKCMTNIIIDNILCDSTT